MLRGIWFVALSVSFVAGSLWAGQIEIPNGSFEAPATNFVSIVIEAWQKSPEPAWYDDSDNAFTWEQLTGLFRNSTPYIENLDGNQAVWLFALPEVALFQEAQTTPDPEFDAHFEVGTEYSLIAGVIGAGGGMSNEVTLEISLYYRDESSNAVTVSAVTVTNTSGLFEGRTNLVDFELTVPAVEAEAPWAGQPLGVQIRSTVGFDLLGGYWVIDNVRLSSNVPPLLLNPHWQDGRFTFTLSGEPGLAFEILKVTEMSSPTNNWTRIATVTNLTGASEFTVPDTSDPGGFFQVRQLP